MGKFTSFNTLFVCYSFRIVFYFIKDLEFESLKQIISSKDMLFPCVQPFDEGGRRIATPSALTGTIGMRLFSTLDDGTGFTPVEQILDAWLEEGIENSTEILQVTHCTLKYDCWMLVFIH